MTIPWQSSVTTGRELDPSLALLEGEAAQQRIKREQPGTGSPVQVWQEVPSKLEGRPIDYYRLPLLKEPVWIWSVPAYFYVGGVAGGTALLAALLHGKRKVKKLAFRCRVLAFLGSTIGPGLLTWDLGRMLRFLYMLRVFRPTSPMSIGSWSLAGTGLLSTISLLLGDKPVARPAALGTAAGGLMLAGYTGVLLGNTANPLWQARRNTLPFLFTASAMASTAGVLEMLPLNKREDEVVRTFGLAGKIGEIACMAAMERQTSAEPEAGRGLKEGKGGLLWKSAEVMVTAGIVLSLIPVKLTWKRRLSGALTTVGAICLRYALLESGKHAAREPRVLIESQN
ncbi:NrfD/PsrC family molybdoenzyme membrane anchor subunit [Geomonas sp.]|uniref:NrfD/PsrC family molybdoenzyme membrane anchor subunit n=1 Tax=Geomonas sp. TaxID=2651584 RepID=UPI002B4760B6|nr:NrfD/PsrC family molybdoenzyme membrane anchor subunit [Geomonas sp.]HJV35426.1 NrfD/PsrC family molybdoenzyme membrane anchor subunit [Geomonas sp.]